MRKIKERTRQIANKRPRQFVGYLKSSFLVTFCVLGPFISMVINGKILYHGDDPDVYNLIMKSHLVLFSISIAIIFLYTSFLKWIFEDVWFRITQNSKDIFPATE